MSRPQFVFLPSPIHPATRRFQNTGNTIGEVSPFGDTNLSLIARVLTSIHRTLPSAIIITEPCTLRVVELPAGPAVSPSTCIVGLSGKLATSEGVYPTILRRIGMIRTASCNVGSLNCRDSL